MQNIRSNNHFEVHTPHKFTFGNAHSEISCLNKDLKRLGDWADSYGLLVNPSKTKALIIGSFKAVTYDLRKNNAQLAQMVIAKVERQDIDQTTNLFYNPEADQYTAIKQHLITAYEESDRWQLQKLLLDMKINDQKPLQILRHEIDMMIEQISAFSFLSAQPPPSMLQGDTQFLLAEIYKLTLEIAEWKSKNYDGYQTSEN
ncbi:hypothetical protein ACJJTC_008041 [Scirpophaga incertulas]